MRVSRNLKIGVLGLFISGIAIWFIVTQIDLVLFANALSSAQYIYVVPCLVLLVLALLPRALRWQVLLNGELPLVRAFHIMNVAYLVNGVLPLRIGEVARIYLASRGKDAVPMLQSASTVVLERLLDLLAIVMLMSLALANGPIPDELRVAGGFTGLIALAGFVVLVVLGRNRQLLHHILDYLTERFAMLQRLNLRSGLDQVLDGLAPVMRPRVLLWSVGLTIVSWLLSVMAGYVLMFAFYEEASWTTTALYISAAAFAIALPAVPGNIGTYELAIMLALNATGYTEYSTGLAFAVMVHAVNVFVHASTGVIGFVAEGVSLGQLTDGVRRMQNVPQESA